MGRPAKIPASVQLLFLNIYATKYMLRKISGSNVVHIFCEK